MKGEKEIFNVIDLMRLYNSNQFEIFLIESEKSSPTEEEGRDLIIHDQVVKCFFQSNTKVTSSGEILRLRLFVLWTSGHYVQKLERSMRPNGRREKIKGVDRSERNFCQKAG